MPPIRRHPSLAELSRQHHQALILAQLLKKNPPVYRGMPQTYAEKKNYTQHFFTTELLPHFLLEEKTLAPFLLGKDVKLDMLLKRMRNEHRQLRQLITGLQAENTPVALLEQIGELLDNHIRMEERELFMLVQELCPPHELEKLESLLSGGGNQ